MEYLFRGFYFVYSLLALYSFGGIIFDILKIENKYAIGFYALTMFYLCVKTHFKEATNGQTNT